MDKGKRTHLRYLFESKEDFYKMKKIIICGNEVQVQEIKSRLNAQKSEIMIFDLSKEYFSADLAECDSIFIAADDFQENKILSMNITDDKIVNFSRFKDTVLDDPIAEMNSDIQYTGLIFGMSHSQCAIQPEKLTDQVYCNCASPSMDMFCHFNYLKKLAETYPEKLENMRHVIIELPYYLFNFDLSRFGTFVYTKLNYFDLIGDYHNFGKTDAQKSKIYEFQLFKSLFSSKKSIAKHSVKKNPIRRITKNLLNKYRIATNKDKVWRVIYQDTVKENQELWKSFLTLFKKACPNAKLTVLVMPFNPIFRCFHKRQINVMKKVFMDSLGTGNFKVIDHFKCLKRDCYFDDHCHLNKKGASKYIKILQKAIIIES